MSNNYKYNFEAKIEAVKLYIRLRNAAETGRILEINSSLILMWHRQYLIGGPKVLLPQSHGNEYDVYDRISITDVWLERMVNGQWVYEKALTPPSYVAINMFDYGAEVDYSEDIGNGTFRVGFTVDADGYSISRYSNSRTF